MRHPYIFLLTMVLVASCGFHLRGSQPQTSSDLASIYLSENRADDIAAEVRAQLRSAGTSIVTTRDKAEYLLRLSNESISQTVLSVSAATGRAEEFQLTLTVTMSVSDRQDNELIADQVIRLARDYTFDAEAVLGTASQQRILEAELVQQAAAQIIRRLHAVSRK